MKAIYLLIFIVLPFQVFSQVFVSGEVKNYDNSFITIGKVTDYELLSGMDTIVLNGTAFEIEIKTTSILAIHIDFHIESNYKDWQRIILFASPGDSIHFEINFLDNNKIPECIFKGTNAKGHHLFYAYQYYPLNFHSAPIKEIIHNKKDADQAQQLFDEALIKLIYPYKKLLIEKEIDSVYYKTSTDFIKSGIVSAVVRSIYENPLESFPSPSYTIADRKKLAIAILDRSPTFKEVNLLANPIFTFLVNNFWHQQAIIRNFSSPKDTIVYLSHQKYVVDKKFKGFFELPNNELKEFYFAHQLHFYYKTMLGEEFVEYYDNQFLFFKAKFPNSKYIPVLEKERKNNAERLHSLVNDPGYAVTSHRYFESWHPILLDDLGLLEQIVSENGQKDLTKGTHFVDIWATWCQPCLKEFQYNYSIDSLLSANDIERIYISIDELHNREKWMSTIYDFHLGGYHILAGDKLKNSLYQQFGNGTYAMLIPRYFFLRDGKIFNANIASLGELKRLKEQIELTKMN